MQLIAKAMATDEPSAVAQLPAVASHVSWQCVKSHANARATGFECGSGEPWSTHSHVCERQCRVHAIIIAMAVRAIHAAGAGAVWRQLKRGGGGAPSVTCCLAATRCVEVEAIESDLHRSSHPPETCRG